MLPYKHIKRKSTTATKNRTDTLIHTYTQKTHALFKICNKMLTVGNVFTLNFEFSVVLVACIYIKLMKLNKNHIVLFDTLIFTL